MHRTPRPASLAALLLAIGCGRVDVTSDASPDPDALVCETGMRACAGQCVANSSPVWAFDDHTCGALGATCLPGSTCQNGSCVAAAASAILKPEYTTFKPVGPDLIAVAGALYWSGRAGFSGGCAPANAGCFEGGPLGSYFGGDLRLVATDGGNALYYYYPGAPAADEIWVLDRVSTMSRRAIPQAGTPNGMAVDAMGNLFYTTTAGQIFVLARGGSTPGVLVGSGPANAQKIVIAGQTLYYTAWGAGATTGEVRAVPIGGAGAFTTLASGQAKPTYLAVLDNHVYWTNQGDGTVWSQNVTTPAAAPVAIASAQAMPLGIAADASAVYWVNQGNGTVMKALRCSGELIELANNQNGATEIVILGGNLYWTAVGANQLMTIPE